MKKTLVALLLLSVLAGSSAFCAGKQKGTAFDGTLTVTVPYEKEYDNFITAFDLAGLSAKPGDTVQVTLTGTASDTTETSWIALVDRSAAADFWKEVATADEGTGISFEKGKQFTETLTLTITDSPSQAPQVHLVMNISKQKKMKNSFSLTNLTYEWKNVTTGQAGNSKALATNHINDEWGDRFLVEEHIAVSIQQGDILKVTLSGTPSANATLTGIQFTDVTGGQWNDVAGNWSLSAPLQRGVPFSQSFYVPAEKSSAPNADIELAVTLSNTARASSLTLTDCTLTWEKADDIAVFPRNNGDWIDRFELLTPTKGFTAKAGEVFRVTVEGTPSENATLRDISFTDRANDGWNDLGGTWKVNVPVRKGVHFSQSFYVSLETAPAKNADVNLMVRFENTARADELTVTDWKLSYEKADIAVSDHWQEDGKHFYSVRVSSKNPSAKVAEGDRIKLSLSGTPGISGTIRGIAIIADSDEWADYAANWDLAVPVQAGVPLSQTFIISAWRSAPKAAKLKVYVRMESSSGAEYMTFERLAADWATVVPFESPIEFDYNDNEWGIYFSYDGTVKSFAAKAGQTVKVTLTGTASADAHLSSVRFIDVSNGGWDVLAANYDTGIDLEKGKPFSVTVALPVEKAITKSMTVKLDLTATTESGTELVIDNSSVSWKVGK